MSDSELNVRDRDLIDFLLSRRSVVAAMMREPGPTEEDLRAIIGAGMRVPDHGRLTPWRFVIIRGEARATLGVVLGESFERENPGAHPRLIEREQGRFVRAPIVVAVISRVLKDHKIPEWEQVLSSGAACQTMLIAALSMGYAAQWLTEWYAYDPHLAKALGLTDGERVAGFLYLGSSDTPHERERPVFEEHVTEWVEAG